MAKKLKIRNQDVEQGKHLFTIEIKVFENLQTTSITKMDAKESLSEFEIIGSLEYAKAVHIIDRTGDRIVAATEKKKAALRSVAALRRETNKKTKK